MRRDGTPGERVSAAAVVGEGINAGSRERGRFEGRARPRGGVISDASSSRALADGRGRGRGQGGFGWGSCADSDADAGLACVGSSAMRSGGRREGGGGGLVGTDGTDGRGDVAPETDGSATVFAPATRALTRAWLDDFGRGNSRIMFFWLG
jgi:hypothetical protein